MVVASTVCFHEYLHDVLLHQCHCSKPQTPSVRCAQTINTKVPAAFYPVIDLFEFIPVSVGE